MAEQKVRVGIAGFGTIGSGVARVILEQADRIAARTGLRLELGCVVDTDTQSRRPVELPEGMLTSDMNRLLNDQSIRIGVELVGGTDAAKQIQLKMLEAGKDVVTANKALLAEHGGELYQYAHKKGRCIAFEAGCAGGVPVISGIRTGLAANDIKAIYGIVNGTCNYVLWSMSAHRKDFSSALDEARQKGYAEADPTLDINGTDSAHKLAILASIAFGYEFRVEDVYVEGIEHISRDDIRFGEEMGYSLKLLAIARKNDKGGISLRVHPSFITESNRLAGVEGAFNALSIIGDLVGQMMFYGRGAGMMPTAGAVVADIIDVALGNSGRSFQHTHLRPREQAEKVIEKIGDLVSRFYIRLMVKDQPGVFAQISRILARNEVSISGVLQHEGRGPENTVPVVIATHPTLQSKVTPAIKGLDSLDTICCKPVCIRIVDIPEDSE